MKICTLLTLLFWHYGAANVFAADLASKPQVESNAHDSIISFDEFASIKEVASRVEETYPETDFLYVGIGRSPTAIIAYLQNQLGDDKAITLPISKFKATDKCGDVSSIPPCYQPPFGNTRLYQTTEHYYYAPLNDKERALLYAHFDRFLLNYIGTKNIVLIDLGYRGDALCSMKEVLKKYLDVRNIHKQIRLFAMVQMDDQMNIAKRAEWSGYDVDSIWLNDRCPFREKLRNHGYDHCGEYGEFIIRHTDAAKVTDPQSLKPQGAYKRFKQALLIHQQISAQAF